MKNTRLTDLMVIGQLVLLVGMIMSFLIETGNIPFNSGAIIISHIYGALLAIAFLLIMASTHDFIHRIGHILAKRLDEKNGEDWNIHLLSLMGITGLLYVGKIAPEIGIVWAAFCLFGTIGTLTCYKDIHSSQGMIWAITIIALIVSMHKWTFLEAHAGRGKWIIAAMVLTFLTSYISKAWKVKQERKKNKEQVTPPSVGADLTKKLSKLLKLNNLKLRTGTLSNTFLRGYSRYHVIISSKMISRTMK